MFTSGFRFFNQPTAAAGNPATSTFADQYSSTANTGSHSFSASIGTAPTGGARRFVVAAFAVIGGNDSKTLSSMTIGGSAATEVCAWAANNGAHNAIYYREVSTGTTATVAFTMSGDRNNAIIDVYTIETDASGLTVVDTDVGTTEDPSLSVAVAVGDIIIGISSVRSTADGVTSYTDGTVSQSLWVSGSNKGDVRGMYDTADSTSYTVQLLESGASQAFQIAAFSGLAP